MSNRNCTTDKRNTAYTKPPGLTGDVADLIQKTAPRCTEAASVVGAISFMAGVCGRAYNVAGVGLNQYMLLLAPTGAGKDGVRAGIVGLSEIGGAVCTADIMSPRKLVERLAATNCFVAVAPEFVYTVQQSARSYRDAGLARFIMSLFSLSGKGYELHASAYLGRGHTGAPLAAPSFSLLGDSTPETFYVAVAEGALSGALLSRFNVIDCGAEVAPLNVNWAKSFLDEGLRARLNTLAARCSALDKENDVIAVSLDSDAIAAFQTLEDRTLKMLTGDATCDFAKSLWNRAHIKALKLAALISVSAAADAPTIDKAAAAWAINYVTTATTTLISAYVARNV